MSISEICKIEDFNKLILFRGIDVDETQGSLIFDSKFISAIVL